MAAKKGHLNSEQLFEVINKYGRYMNTTEFKDRMLNHVRERKVQEPGPMMDELEVMQKLLWAEWDLYPHVSPEEAMEDLHNAATNYATDKKIMGAMHGFVQLVEVILNNLLSVQNPELLAKLQKEQGMTGGGGAHGHSHNGVPCNGSHGHSHGGGAPGGGMGAPPGMPPQQFAMIQQAVQNALNPEERAHMANVQKNLMGGQRPTAEEQTKMVQIQAKIKAYVETMQGMMQMMDQQVANSAAGGAGGDSADKKNP